MLECGTKRSIAVSRFNAWALWLALGLACQPAGPTLAAETLDMSLEELLDVQITSVSKRLQSLSDAAAAVFVITREDLRRSGATSIPEALRMVPGLYVARIDANKWAVTARGFNGRFANKLLVMVDGRTVYSPSFSGVYWEMQDVMLEDVERIEVIRGPGATVWGANAVNGVINVITRHAADTQQGLAVLGGGNEERGFAAARYGARVGEGTYGRIYAKAFERDSFVNADGGDANDGWRALRAGFRVDSLVTDRDDLTLQGEIYRGDLDQTVELADLDAPFVALLEDKADMAGGHLIARWDHRVSADSQWTLQAYYDHFDRNEAFLRERRNTLDLDLTHRMVLDGGHELVWGLGYRYTGDDFRSSPTVRVEPESREDQLFGAFVQDEIELMADALWLTLGSKFEHNDYTGLEVQPSARLFWALDPANRLWAAVSRAVRTPSRMEHDSSIRVLVFPPSDSFNPLPLPLETYAAGNRDFDAEKLTAYELGYRTSPLPGLNLDLVGFYNDYDNLRTFAFGLPVLADPPTHFSVPALFANGVPGRTYGAELAAIWQAMPWVRFDLAYSYIETEVDWPNVDDMAQNTPSPRHKASLRSSIDVRPDVDLDVWLRYVGRTQVYREASVASTAPIDDYLNLDIRLAWRPMPDLELFLVGQNLLDNRRLEYVQESFTLPTEVERGVYAGLEWRF